MRKTKDDLLLVAKREASVHLSVGSFGDCIRKECSSDQRSVLWSIVTSLTLWFADATKLSDKVESSDLVVAV